MVLMRELESGCTTTAERCVRKTTGGGVRGFFSRHCLQTHRHIHTDTHTVTYTHTHTPLTCTNTHSHIHINTYTYKHTNSHILPVNTHTHKHTLTLTYTKTHTFTLTQMHRQSLNSSPLANLEGSKGISDFHWDSSVKMVPFQQFLGNRWPWCLLTMILRWNSMKGT